MKAGVRRPTSQFFRIGVFHGNVTHIFSQYVLHICTAFKKSVDWFNLPLCGVSWTTPWGKVNHKLSTTRSTDIANKFYDIEIIANLTKGLMIVLKNVVSNVGLFRPSVWEVESFQDINYKINWYCNQILLCRNYCKFNKKPNDCRLLECLQSWAM